MDENELVTYCDCGDPAHMMVFHYWREEEDPLMDELFVSVQLNQLLPWWKRVWVALEYIFGKQSRYSFGHWDEGSIRFEDVKKLRALLTKYIQHRNILVKK